MTGSGRVGRGQPLMPRFTIFQLRYRDLLAPSSGSSLISSLGLWRVLLACTLVWPGASTLHALPSLLPPFHYPLSSLLPPFHSRHSSSLSSSQSRELGHPLLLLFPRKAMWITCFSTLSSSLS